MKNLLVVLALLGVVAPAGATVVSTTAFTTSAVKFINAPGVSGQASVLKGCSLGNNTPNPICVTVAGQFALDPSFLLCAGSTATVTMGGGLQASGDYPAKGNLGSMFGESLTSTGTWTVKQSSLVSGLLLTCSYAYQWLK